MSLQRDAVNLTLKTFVKPIAARLPFDSPLISANRNHIDTFATILSRAPVGVTIDTFLIDHMEAEWLTPDYLTQDDKVLLYFHGGGYIMGSPKTHRNLTGRLATVTQMKVLAINYRKAPKHAFPCPIDDAIYAYEYLLNMGYEPENILFGGDSAGGNLTVTALLSLKERGYPLPRAGICMSPWTDLTMSGGSMYYNRHKDPMLPNHVIAHAATSYCAAYDPTNPLISPIFADLSGLPPLLVHVGDTEVLLDDSNRLVKKARNDGVDVRYKQWSKQPHVFQLFAGLIPQSTHALWDIGRFITETFQKEPTRSALVAFTSHRSAGKYS